MLDVADVFAPRINFDRSTRFESTDSGRSSVARVTLLCIRLAKKSNNPDALKLNYKYRLYPTETQAFHLGRSMRRATHWWNNLCKGYRYAKEIIRRGHASRLRADLVKSIRDKGDTGQRTPKLTKMMEELGCTREAAQAKLCQTDIDKIFAFKDYKRPDGTVVRKPAMGGNVLAMRWAIARVKASNDQSESGLSKAFKETTDRYEKTWGQFWKSRREPNKPPAGKPRKKRVGTDALSIGYQNQAKNDAIILKNNCVRLSGAFAKRFEHSPEMHEIRILLHRPLPEGGLIKHITINRTSTGPDAEWYVVFTVEIAKPEHQLKVKHQFPTTGLLCGADPGRTVGMTVVGQDSVAMQSERLPETLDERIVRFQQRLARQTYVNNKECFGEDGVWKKGARLKRITKGMRTTQSRIQTLMRYRANWRLDQTYKFLHNIFKRYDEMLVGDWADGSPESKRKLKKKRKADVKRGITRAWGQASRERTQNRLDRANANGLFRQKAKEIAARSTVPKIVTDVSEKEIKSTQRCPDCDQLTGPKTTNIREWTCSCGSVHQRDVASARNHLNYGLRGRNKLEPEGQPGIARTSSKAGMLDANCERQPAVEKPCGARVPQDRSSHRDRSFTGPKAMRRSHAPTRTARNHAPKPHSQLGLQDLPSE